MLFEAVISNDIEKLKLHLQNETNLNLPDTTGNCLIHYAVELQHHEILELLIQNGANVNKEGKENTIFDHFPICIAAFNGDLKATKLLVENKADINIVEGMESALNIAVRFKNPEVVDYLLSKSADTTNFIHMTAGFGTLEQLTNLIDSGYNIDETDEFTGATPLSHAASNKNIPNLNFLIENGANLLHRNENGESSLIAAIQSRDIKSVQILIQAGADVNLPSYCNISPLIYAIWRRNYEISKLLLENGADAEFQNPSNGDTPLITAAGIYDITQLLLSFNANVNAQNFEGSTALHLCFMFPDENYFEFLIENGANIDIISDTLGSVMSCAVDNNFLHGVRLLILKGFNVTREKYVIEDVRWGTYAVQIVKLLIQAGLSSKRFKYDAHETDPSCLKLITLINKYQNNPLNLQQLCRIKLQHYWGKLYQNILKRVDLPHNLKTFLRFEEFVLTN